MAWGHQSSLTSSGQPLKWHDSNVDVSISTNTSDLSASTTRTIIQNSINQWNGATSKQVSSNSSSHNTISFSQDFSIYGSGVIGVTEVSYSPSGVINRANIILNDTYQFTSSPGLYSTGQIYLGDVVTHELGHFYGLSHSEVLNSSMFYSAFSGQSSISYDDKSGIRKKYDEDDFGSIRGQVKGGAGVGVLGVHVQAISRKTGEALGAFTDENGYFAISGLDIGDSFYIYTAPIKNSNSLPDYFSNVQNDFCPGTFVGSFFQACGRSNDGEPQAIHINQPGEEINVGVVTINCTLRANANYNYQKLQSSFSKMTMFEQLGSRYEKAFVGHFRTVNTSAWSTPENLEVDLRSFGDLSGHQKYLKISVIAYPFGNQLQYDLSVKKDGSPIYGSNQVIPYSSSTETYHTDLNAFVALDDDASKNLFEISLRSKKLTNSLLVQTFPSYEQFSSNKTLPHLYIVSLWEETFPGVKEPLLSSGSTLSDNNSCLDAPFTYAVSKAQSHDQKSTASSAAAGAGCGTIEPPSDKGNGPGSQALMAFGFLFAILLSRSFKTGKKFLS